MSNPFRVGSLDATDNMSEARLGHVALDVAHVTHPIAQG
jgi:hypothetical protein